MKYAVEVGSFDSTGKPSSKWFVLEASSPLELLAISHVVRVEPLIETTVEKLRDLVDGKQGDIDYESRHF